MAQRDNTPASVQAIATVSAGFAKALADFAELRGASRCRLLAASGLTDDAFEDPDDRVAFTAFVELMRSAKRLTGDSALPLEFGAATDLRHFSIAGLIAHSAATMTEALVQLNRYGRLVAEVDLAGEGPRFAVSMENGRRWMTDLRANPNAVPELTETTWSRFICWTRKEFPAIPFALGAEVTHDPPEHADAYERIWQVPIRFSAARNAIQTSVDWGEVAIAPEQRYVFGVLTSRGDALLEELSRQTTLRGRVEAALLPVLHTGAFSADAVARALGTTRRTLHRGLAGEGTSFSSVLDGLRRRMALAYLDAKRASVQETAYLVGFSDPSSFSRAFKRWTGRRPGASRD